MSVDQVFKRQFTDLANESGLAADRLYRQIQAFCRDPWRCGFFLRGADDGRQRYLVPASCGADLADAAVAVVELQPASGTAELMRLVPIEGMHPEDIIAEARQRAEREYAI
jgi:hypothetical protein